MRRIPVAGPSITNKEVEYVADAARHAWYANASDYHNRFESAFRGYLNTAHAMALPSCTSAIHLALASLGIGRGDEVIVPDVTWIATSAPIDYVGATVVFADIDPVTWCLSTASVERCITPRTKAIVAVDLYGGVPDYAGLRELAKAFSIPIIEDAAEAIGAEYQGAKAGTLGDVGTFSFHGSKTLTTGEGGMLVSGRADVWARASTLRDHGRAPGDVTFVNSEVAFKYKMSALQAALGLAQLERIEELVAKKRETFAWYQEELGGVEGIAWNAEPKGTRNAFWMTTAVLHPERRISKVQMAARLSERGVETRPFFHPLSTLPAYADRSEAAVARRRNVHAARVSESGVNLPCSGEITRDDVARVAAAFRSALDE